MKLFLRRYIAPSGSTPPETIADAEAVGKEYRRLASERDSLLSEDFALAGHAVPVNIDETGQQCSELPGEPARLTERRTGGASSGADLISPPGRASRRT